MCKAGQGVWAVGAACRDNDIVHARLPLGGLAETGINTSATPSMFSIGCIPLMGVGIARSEATSSTGTLSDVTCTIASTRASEKLLYMLEMKVAGFSHAVLIDQ